MQFIQFIGILFFQFCPYVRGNSQYLVSTGGDGCLCLWEFDTTTKVFKSVTAFYFQLFSIYIEMLIDCLDAKIVFRIL